MATRSAPTRGDRVGLGLDFGTESVRAVLVDLRGNVRGSATSRFRRGQITETHPSTGRPLPSLWALQDSEDWERSAARAVRAALRSSGLDASSVIGIGVDFTSCTMLPCREDGTPLHRMAKLERRPHAWPKLWKHHAAGPQTERINELAARMREPWLAHYGGQVGLEWLIPKVLEVVEGDIEVHRRADCWIEAGDWYVWRLTGAALPVRSTCQAGYKACWTPQSARDTRGYPSRRFLRRLHPEMESLVEDKLRGELIAPGQVAGELCPAMAKTLGLHAGVPVSAAIIDAHAGVPGAGVASPDILVLVLGTSSCHMLMSRRQTLVPGVAGVVRDGILPGFYGYETGQAAVGDAFAWIARTTRHSLADLGRAASHVEPGSGGVTCLDWFNGCRTPLMNGSLHGAFTGLTLGTRPEQMYRAAVEATGFGLRWIVELFEEAGVPVKRCVATGGLPHHDPLIVRTYADILGRPITVHPSRQGPAVGSAILGVLCAGRKLSGFGSVGTAVRGMAGAGSNALTVRPRKRDTETYNDLYRRYRELASFESEGRIR